MAVTTTCMRWLAVIALALLCIATATNADTVLTPGTSIQESFIAEEWKYYSVDTVGQGDAALTIVVTRLGTSGDPDIFADPTTIHPDSSAAWKNLREGDDSLTITKAQYGTATTIYIGIHNAGQQPTTVTILAKYKTAVKLQPARPQRSQLSIEAKDFYTFLPPVTENHGDATFVVTPIAGSVTLYIGTGATSPDPADTSTYFWRSPWASQGEPVIVYKNDLHWPADHIPFQLTVSASTSATYDIVASTNATAVTLRDGIPYSDHVEGGSAEYFVFQVDAPTCIKLTIQVTPLTGDPDLYVSRTNTRPSSASYEKSSLSSFGIDSVTYDNAPVSFYYIGVTAWSNTSFSVMAACSSYVTLLDGMPQSGNLERTATAYYKVTVLDHHTDLTISLSRQYGDPDLYVTNPVPYDGRFPGPANYQWQSLRFGDDLIVIHSDDVHACVHCTYYIAVRASSACRYTVRASTSAAIVRLQDGIAVHEALTALEYDYFQVTLTSLDQHLTVVLTDMGLGDPDLFISTTNPHPNSTACDWKSTSWGMDAISIPPSDPKYRQLGTYYISVFAYSNTTFSLVAKFTGRTILQDGTPQNGHADRFEMVPYVYRPYDVQHEITVTLTTTVGLGEMYISTTGYPEKNVPSSYQWFAPWYSSAKSIVIRATEPHACTTSTCMYYISVYGVSNTSYTVVAATRSAVIPLIPGIPQREHVETGLWQFFSVRVNNQNQDLTILCTRITGDPDLYVKLNFLPNETYYDRRSVNWGSDSVDFENVAIGTYFIGVKAYDNSTFSILASLDDRSAADNATVIRLLDGEPQTANLHHSHYRYYRFTLVGEHEDVTFTLTKEFGDPDLYINYGEAVFPTTFINTWSSVSMESDVVRIQGPAAGTYIIGVYAYATCAYTLTAASSAIITTLQDGVPLRGQLTYRASAFYRLPVDSADWDITIALTTVFGDPDLYISTTAHFPGPNNYTWSAAAFRDDSITIGRTDAKFCAHCTYYIAVYSYSACDYSIVAQFAQEQQLADGRPQQGHVAVGAMTFYKFRVADGVNEVTFTATPISGSAVLYITSNGKLPTVTDYDWRSLAWSGTATVTISPSDTKFCRDAECIYYIGVRGQSACDYSIVASSSHEITTLRDGIPVHDVLSAGQTEYFSFTTYTCGLDITLVLTAISGDPDMFVSTKYRRPNRTNSEWSSTTWGDDSIVIPNTMMGTYFISVLGWSNTSFIITAYTTTNDSQSSSILIDGVPHAGQVALRGWKYYHFYLRAQHSDLTITLTRRSGDPDLYVSHGTRYPNLTSYDWSSSAWGQDLITIHGPPQGEFIIGVYGYSQASYLIAASTNDAILTLIDGVPFREDLQAGKYEFFQMAVDRTDKDLTVTVTSFNGDPDLFISDIVERPTVDNYTWAARSFREDAITIPADKLHLGVYYISVNAFTNCTFTVMASFAQRKRVQDGVPQAGTILVQEQAVYYELSLDNTPHDFISFTATPVTGNVYLYVGTERQPQFGDASSYSWSSINFYGVQTITAHHGERGFCRGCVYYIMVYGRTAANFTVMAQSSKAILALQNGVPQTSWLSTDAYGYFSFRCDIQKAVLLFTVTPLSGDPDLYVSAIVQRPTEHNYQWQSRSWGSDTIMIDYNDDNYVWSHGASSGTYYIGVLAWQNTTFTITASMLDVSDNDTSHDVLLINSQPQIGYLPHSGQQRYYSFFVTERRDVTITITPRFGDPDIYIRNDGNLARIDYYQWKSTLRGADSITISALDGCASCRYSILVVAATQSLFSIVASTGGGMVQLESGIPFTGQLQQGNTAYYYTTVDRDDDELVISCNGLSGDPDLFVSMVYQFPNDTAYEWRSSRWGTDILTIPHPSRGRYFIAVYAWETTTYIITTNLGPITLIDGQPHDDQLLDMDTRYYMFHVPNDASRRDKDTTFALSLNDDGRAIVYVSLNNTQPSAADHQWSSQDPSTSEIRNMVTIPAAKSCIDCSYFISVVGMTSRVVYSLVVFNSDSGIMLFPGQPLIGSVAAKKSTFYRCIVDGSGFDVNIDLTTYKGDIQVYVSTNTSKPDANNYQWTSGHDVTSRGDHIGIDHKAAGFRPGIYYIGVYGFEESTYSIVLATGKTLLRAGVPQLATTNIDGTYFFLNIDQEKKVNRSDILFVLGSASSSGDPSNNRYEVWISTNVTSPSRERGFTWHQSMREGETLQIRQTDREFKLGATYYIGVFGVGAAVSGTPFTIKASLAESVEVLFDDAQPVRGVIMAGEYKYYEIFVSTAVNFTITLEPCTGNSDLYMSQKTFLPTQQSYQWASEQAFKIDQIRVFDPTITKTTFFVGVYGQKGDVAGSSQYMLSASSRLIESLRAGGDGLIFTATPGAGQVQLTFAPAWTKGLATDLKYQIYGALQTRGVVMYSLCGLESLGVTRYGEPFYDSGSAAGGAIVRVIKNLAKATVYTFNVVVEDKSGNRVVYSPQFVTTSNGDVTPSDDGISLSTILGIVIPAFGVTLAFIVALIIKNKKLTKELSVEMHDVPKAALRKAVRGPDTGVEEDEKKANNATKKYSRLLTDEDESSETYAPPAEFDAAQQL